MKHILFLGFILFSSIAIGQENHISGFVYDHESKEPLSYATFQLFEIENSRFIIGTITDSAGGFTINDIPLGNYYYIIKTLGYKSYQDTLSVEKKVKTYLIPEVFLIKDLFMLQQVEVKAEAKVTTRLDRTVVVMDSLDLSDAITSLDVMKKIPELKVNDIANAVSIKGKEASMVMINGVNRLNSIDIRSINPDDIAKIEIITDPASGMESNVDGIINIILKEKPSKGFNLSAGLDYLLPYRSIDPYVSFQFGWKKIRLNIDNFFSYKAMDITNDFYREDTLEQIYTMKSHAINPQEYFNITRIGLDYYINKNNFINFSSDNTFTYSKNIFNNISEFLTNNERINLTRTKNTNYTNVFLGNYTLFYKP